MRLILGDCLEMMRGLPDNSVDSVVTDPPYGLSFMGKKWDYDVPDVNVWQECLRVLKPGGHLLAFAGTRTQHRMACRIEDAGFEIRDMIAWVYGSGFPKSMNVGKALSDTENAKEWEGWGTTLKPAMEPITVARKPIKANTIAQNVVQYGTGAINIDDCRIGTGNVEGEGCWTSQPLGRWPANLIHDGSDEVVGLFPLSKGQQGDVRGTESSFTGQNGIYGKFNRQVANPKRGDYGSAARFFYCAKTTKKDRNEGLEGFEEKNNMMVNGPRENEEAKFATKMANFHPTVKPTDLMRYLCRLVTPKNGTVLDLFMGSGSTGKACVLEGFDFIGIEREEEYYKIAEARIKFAEQTLSVGLKGGEYVD